jgi:predicted GIY-YIG superfamily endonuclease
LSVDPDVAETGQPYAFTGDDPLNATDPLGLDKVYIISRNGEIRYIGRSNLPERRLKEHIRSGKFDEKAGDTFKELDTEDLSLTEAKGVEQIAINTARQNGAQLINRNAAISPKNPAYDESMIQGNDVLLHSPNALLQVNNGNAAAATEQFQGMVIQESFGVPEGGGAISDIGGEPGDEGGASGFEVPGIDF